METFDKRNTIVANVLAGGFEPTHLSSNPVSGCLPMLAQFPVFIALFNALRLSINLKCSPFIFWIKDLSVPDTVATLNLMNFSIPVNILPILMGVTMLLQQHLQGTNVQTEQQKFMKYLPLFFLVLFWTFPSGLVLYWLTNNVVTIIQTLIVMKTSK